MTQISLQQAWNFCIDSIPSVNKKTSESVYENIISAYTAPERGYHNVDHLMYMINMIQEMLNIYLFNKFHEKKAILFLATFFHDMYMDFNSDDPPGTNERKSAIIACDMMNAMGINTEIIDNVMALIQLTGKHELNPNGKPEVLMQKIFLDADMAILGAEPYKYDAYREGINEEYAHIDREVFISHRMSFLQQYAEKKAIFYTEYMNQIYLDQVMENLKVELKLLDSEYADLLIHQTT